jgi:hypothetical protein
MSSFGEPTNGRGEFQPGLNEHLFLNNSGGLRQSMIQPKKGKSGRRPAHFAGAGRSIDRLFLAVLTRPPSEQERRKFVEYVAAEEPARPSKRPFGHCSTQQNFVQSLIQTIARKNTIRVPLKLRALRRT